jgi:eukaryotic-like serine/threonine-protein kinase
MSPAAPITSSPTRSKPVPKEELRAYLARIAPERERTIAAATGAMSLAFAAMIISILLVSVGIDQVKTAGRPGYIAAIFTGTFGAYKSGLYLVLRRGWWRTWVPWISVVVEIAWVLAMMGVIGRSSADETIEGSLIAPGFGVLFLMIATSGLRASRALALTSGVLASAGYIALYFAGRSGAPATVAYLQPGTMVMRGLILAGAGGITALIAHWFIKSAEEALSAARERDVFGKYLLHERVAAGGMAEVFRATYCPEGGFKKSVAVKRILPGYVEDPEFMALFREEARLGALLVHPNIVQVLDFGSYQGTYFLSMEYVDGLSLSRLLRTLPVPLSARAATYITAEIAAALEYIHNRRGPSGAPLHLVHRDVNPPNILLSRTGEVKLADFGIARAADRARVTHVGLVRGKPGYMAPEQERGENLDARTDLFALGATFYEALTGTPAFKDSAEGVGEIARSPVPPSAARGGVPREIDAIVESLLQLEPAARTQTGGDLRAQLLRLPEPTRPYPFGQNDLARCVVEAMEAQQRRDASEKRTIPASPDVNLPSADSPSR